MANKDKWKFFSIVMGVVFMLSVAMIPAQVYATSTSTSTSTGTEVDDACDASYCTHDDGIEVLPVEGRDCTFCADANEPKVSCVDYWYGTGLPDCDRA